MTLNIDTLPGLEGNFKYFCSGGDGEWLPFNQRKHYTNAFIVQNDQVLLGYKKRGFGKHMYNGFGGKVEPGETSIQAAVRELREEAGIDAPLTYAGTLFFVNKGAEWAFHIDIYRADEYSGTITETDEMRPQWFSCPDSPRERSHPVINKVPNVPPIPSADMWFTDQFWLPLLLSKRTFVGRADYLQEGDVFTELKWWFGFPSD